jgi:hypothetical protein
VSDGFDGSSESVNPELPEIKANTGVQLVLTLTCTVSLCWTLLPGSVPATYFGQVTEIVTFAGFRPVSAPAPRKAVGMASLELPLGEEEAGEL